MPPSYTMVCTCSLPVRQKNQTTRGAPFPRMLIYVVNYLYVFFCGGAGGALVCADDDVCVFDECVCDTRYLWLYTS